MTTELEPILSGKYQTDKQVYNSEYNTKHTFKYNRDDSVFIVKMSKYNISGYFTTKADADKYAMNLARDEVSRYTLASPNNHYVIEYNEKYTTLWISYKTKILWVFYDSPHILAVIKIYEIPKILLA